MAGISALDGVHGQRADGVGEFSAGAHWRRRVLWFAVGCRGAMKRVEKGARIFHHTADRGKSLHGLSRRLSKGGQTGGFRPGGETFCPIDRNASALLAARRLRASSVRGRKWPSIAGWLSAPRNSQTEVSSLTSPPRDALCKADSRLTHRVNFLRIQRERLEILCALCGDTRNDCVTRHRASFSRATQFTQRAFTRLLHFRPLVALRGTRSTRTSPEARRFD